MAEQRPATLTRSAPKLPPAATDRRVFVWAEDRTHRPVFTPSSYEKRGCPTLASLSANDVEALFRSCARLPHGRGLAANNLQDEHTGLRIYLLPSGANVPLPDGLRLLRDGDELLIRAGGEPRIRSPGADTPLTRHVRVNAKIMGLAQVGGRHANHRIPT